MPILTKECFRVLFWFCSFSLKKKFLKQVSPSGRYLLPSLCYLHLTRLEIIGNWKILAISDGLVLKVHSGALCPVHRIIGSRSCLVTWSNNYSILVFQVFIQLVSGHWCWWSARDLQGSPFHLWTTLLDSSLLDCAEVFLKLLFTDHTSTVVFFNHAST